METSTCNSEDTLEELIRKTVDLLPENYDDSQDFGIDQLGKKVPTYHAPEDIII